MRMRKTLGTLFATVWIALAAAAAPATAQNQTGLVNINISNNVVQVPVAIAANVCDIEVAVLVGRLHDTGSSTCDATALSTARITPREPGGGRDARQAGLINVNIEDNTVQVPIAAAVNICDVTVAILVGEILKNGATECTADAGAEGIA
jgi:hypothetical protein